MHLPPVLHPSLDIVSFSTLGTASLLEYCIPLLGITSSFWVLHPLSLASSPLWIQHLHFEYCIPSLGIALPEFYILSLLGPSLGPSLGIWLPHLFGVPHPVRIPHTPTILLLPLLPQPHPSPFPIGRRVPTDHPVLKPKAKEGRKSEAMAGGGGGGSRRGVGVEPLGER